MAEHSWPEGAKQVRLHDPARPTVAGNPGLLRPDGSSMNSVVPMLVVNMEDEHLLTVSAFIIIYGSTARRFEVTLELSALPAFFSRWAECPERVCVEEFGWWPEQAPAKVRDFRPVSRPRPGAQELSLDDLENLL